jgi:hypothetical protein
LGKRHCWCSSHRHWWVWYETILVFKMMMLMVVFSIEHCKQRLWDQSY